MSPSYSPGPWWWRVRCWLSQRVLTFGAWLEPDDRVTEHEELPNGRLRFFDARRETPLHRSKGVRFKIR